MNKASIIGKTEQAHSKTLVVLLRLPERHIGNFNKRGSKQVLHGSIVHCRRLRIG